MRDTDAIGVDRKEEAASRNRHVGHGDSAPLQQNLFEVHAAVCRAPASRQEFVNTRSDSSNQPEVNGLETPSPRYADVDARKSEGATYTPDLLARFVAREMVQLTKPWLRERRLHVLDPAVGEGSLALALLDALRAEGFTSVSFLGLDTDPNAAKVAYSSASDRYPGYQVRFEVEDFLQQIAPKNAAGDLFTPLSPQRSRFDLIIANPPYVRTQVLGGQDAQALAKRFSLSGRVDLYYAFLLAIADALTPDGIAGIIVSNRFMTTKAGASVRETLPELMRIHSVWDLGDSKLFDAAVLPAVLLGTGFDHARASGASKPRFTSLYSTSMASQGRAQNPVDALQYNGVVELDDGRRFQVQRGVLNHGTRRGDVWRVATEEIQDWIEAVQRTTWCTFGDLGKIRVGVKTTADRVFIREDWSDCGGDEPELLRPLITHHIAHRYRAAPPTRQILYPHVSENGRCVPVDLSRYPRAATYLNRHRSTLEGRKYVAKAGRRWYEIWVPQDPAAWDRPKLVFRDIAERPVFWMDMSGAVVNGDCYWLAPSTGTNAECLWLALAVANSTFCEVYYDRRFNNKLYAGRRRFITQYVEHFPIPDPESCLATHAVNLAKSLFEMGHDAPAAPKTQKELDLLVWQIFGLPVPEEVCR